MINLNTNKFKYLVLGVLTLFIVLSNVQSQLLINIQNQGGEVIQETITSNVSDDLVTLEFQRTDGTLISQLIDFRNEVKVLKALVLGEEERGQSQYQVMCFVTKFIKGDFISADAMAKLRQKNPSTVRIPEEDKGKETITMTSWIHMNKSTPITRHLSGLCSEAVDATYVRDIDVKAWAELPGCVPARYILAILGSLGMAIVYGLKVNLSVAMVAMLNHTAIAHASTHGSTKNLGNNTFNVSLSAEKCSAPDDDSYGVPQDGPFAWSEPLQGTLLSCYFWGYIVSQIPGAQIAENYSAKWVMFFSVAINVICTLLTPIMTKIHYVGLILLRVLEGIGGGATFPAMHCMIAAWAPPNERSVMSTIIYVGTAFGTAKSILTAGILAGKFGWESVFYVMGGFSCLWMILWIILVQDSPNKQSLISYEERTMINSQLGTIQTEGVTEKHPPVPWKKVLTSVPFWAILIAHVCSNWGWYMFLIEIPFYMKQVLQFNVSKNAVASALPYYPMFLFSIVLGKVLDTLKAKGYFSTTICRKTATSFATLVPGVCLLSLCYIGCHRDAAVAFMTFGIIGMGGMFSGFLSNHIDIAPNYAGTLVALTNTVATLPGIIVPLFVGFITKGNQNIGAWRIIFFVTIVLFTIEFIVFTLFASGEEQSWNKSGSKTDPEQGDQNESTPLKNTNASSPVQDKNI